MKNQVYIIIAFFTAGICIGTIFDMFRVSRKSFKTPNLLIYIEDVLFWALAGGITLFVIGAFTDGQIRLYMILMQILGALIYFSTISKYFIKINTAIVLTIKKFLNIILNPLKKLVEILKKLQNLKKFSKKSGK